MAFKLVISIMDGLSLAPLFGLGVYKIDLGRILRLDGRVICGLLTYLCTRRCRELMITNGLYRGVTPPSKFHPPFVQ